VSEAPRRRGRRRRLLVPWLVALIAPACVQASAEHSSATITRRGRSAGAEAPEAAPPDAGVEEVVAIPDAGSAEDVPFDDERPALEVLEGRASYYADRFEGRSTASGEPYRASALTAASRDLPFGTIVRVVRVDTGASVVVRVNDRGPFGDHRRILDLSRAAAEQLDMIRAGVIEIRAEILERGAGRRRR
jgi:rare lipoprotein A